MQRSVTLVVGLGNPGSAYARTRHNVGFDVVDILAQSWDVKINKHKCRASTCETQRYDRTVVLAQPQTYMNDSGESFVQLVNWYKPAPQDIIVVYDDIDLPVGRLRVRPGGSAGTHNGMRSILYLHGRDDFPRVRVGIGKPPEGWDLKDWVLSRYREEEQKPQFDALKRAAEAVEFMLAHSVEDTMQKYNGV